VLSLLSMELSSKIKALRESLGVRQSDMARLLNLDPTYYPKLEKRGEGLRVDQLMAIAQALGVTVVDILTYGEAQPTVSTVEAERVKRLEEENGVLKDRLKDKQTISEKYKSDIEWIAQYFEVRLNMLLEWFAEKLELGQIYYKGTLVGDLKGLADGNVEKYFSKIFNWDDFEESRHYEHRLSEDEKVCAAIEVFKDEKFRAAAAIMMYSGLVELEVWHKAFGQFPAWEFRDVDTILGLTWSQSQYNNRIISTIQEQGLMWSDDNGRELDGVQYKNQFDYMKAKSRRLKGNPKPKGSK
jgi:transcriptional regulator with XRE-family HTH domain